MKCMKFIRSRYNRLLESAIRLSMLTAVSFVVTACYGMPPDYPNDPEWTKQQDTLEHRILSMAPQSIESDSSTPSEDEPTSQNN